MSSDLTGHVVTDAWAGVGERLGARSDAIMREYGVSGAAVALVEAGEVVYVRGFGVTSVDSTELPVTPRTLFRIGSVAKPLAGTAILRLVEAGILDLDRLVGEYVGGLRFSDPKATERI